MRRHSYQGDLIKNTLLWQLRSDLTAIGRDNYSIHTPSLNRLRHSSPGRSSLRFFEMMMAFPGPPSHILKCAKCICKKPSSPSAISLLTAKFTLNIYTMRLSLAVFFLLSAASCVFAAAIPVAKREVLSERGSGSGYGNGSVDY